MVISMKEMTTYEVMQWKSDALPIRVHYNDRINRPVLFQHHWHKQIELMYVLQGSIKLTCDNKEFVGQANDVMLVNSNQVHYAQSLTERVGYYILIIDYDIFRDFRGDIVHSKYIEPIENNIMLFINHIGNDSAMISIIREIIGELQTADAGYEFAIKAVTCKLLVQLIREYKDQHNSYRQYLRVRKKQAGFQQVFAYIDANFTHDLSTRDLADLQGVSSEHFCRSFKALTGMTVMNYINQMRVNLACELLHDESLSILAIATQVGFSSSPYFCKVFKEYMQRTPTEYRLGLS